jgi:nucleoside-diphosphate-sugar epimerase
MQRIAVTGSNGTIGRRLCPDLAKEYEVVRIDRANADVNLDIADMTALKRAFEQCGTVIHLAATVSMTAPWEDVLQNNVAGTYNVFEAARQAGCARVIFASSFHVVGMYQREHRENGKGSAIATPLSADVPPRPDSTYAVSKVFGEALGRYFSDVFGIQVACIRIGSINDADSANPPRFRLPWRNTEADKKRRAAKWFSHRDFARLVRAILERKVQYSIVYGVGDNANRFLDLSPGRELYDYLPLDGAK